MPKKKYVAKVGIDFEGLKEPVRVEPGDEIPAGVPQKEIDGLVQDGIVEEAN